MNTCPACGSEELVKDGLNPSGSQRHQCRQCGRIMTLQPLPNGYSPAIRTQALRLYLDGNGFRAIARQLGLNHQTVANWIKHQPVPVSPLPAERVGPEIVEVDELFTFVRHKKTKSTL
jgi:transposase-like protein